MIEADLRDRLLAEPEVILEDRDLMRALIAANDRALGSNVVDLRGMAMQRLEHRLERLEDTHRSVIAAAYENLAGTNQIHRAVLRMMEPLSFGDFLTVLGRDVAAILRIDSLRLVLESATPAESSAVRRVSDVVTVVEPGFIDQYLTGGRPALTRPVTLRQAPLQAQGTGIYGARAEWVQSEALLKLDLGVGRLPGLLALGSEDPHHFKPAHGTDLLTFFGGVFERSMQRWLA